MKYLLTKKQFQFLTENIYEDINPADPDSYDDLINKSSYVGTKSTELEMERKRQQELKNQEELKKAEELKKQENIPSQTTTSSGSSETKSVSETILDTAKNQVGIKYKWGGTKPTTGFDCSGLVSYVTGLPRQTANGYFSTMTKVSKKDVKPGDIVFFGNGSTQKAGHAGIVKTVDENGNISSMIHARGRQSCPGDKVTPNCKVEETTNMDWYKPILGYGRVS